MNDFDDGNDGRHGDPNWNSNEKANRFGNANDHEAEHGKVNQNEHGMHLGIENQYSNDDLDGDANAN